VFPAEHPVRLVHSSSFVAQETIARATYAAVSRR
jgi:hypothetical protein